MRNLREKTILITGAGRGIGKRLAFGFAQAGAQLGLLARSKAELDLLALEIEHLGGSALRLRADVRNFDQVAEAAERLRISFGSIHALVCAAGVQGPIGPVAGTPPEAWAETLAVNVVGAYHACRAVLPQMIERRSGKIILLSGGGAESPRPNFAAYAASKAALARFAETLAEEVRDANIQVNCLAPGGAYTSMTDEILKAPVEAGEREAEEAARIRATGGVAPEKQIQLALFLLSERANHISGKLIGVTDDWRKLEHANLSPELYTLRRLQRP